MVYFRENPNRKWIIWGYPHDLGNHQITAKEATHLLALPQLAALRIYRPAAAHVGVPTPEDPGVAGGVHLRASQKLVAERSSQEQTDGL